MTENIIFFVHSLEKYFLLVPDAPGHALFGVGGRSRLAGMDQTAQAPTFQPYIMLQGHGRGYKTDHI